MRSPLPALDQPAAERDVERDQIVDLRAAQLDQRLFGREQIALGVEHFEIGRYAFAIPLARKVGDRSEEHTSELQSLMRISYAVFCLKKKHTASEFSHLDRSRTTITSTPAL